MTGYSTSWSAEDQQKVREAVAAGMSATDIGALIGRTKKAVHCGVKRYGLGSWPCLDDREMPEGFAEDAPVLGLQAIMKKYKCGDKNARKWRAELGVTAVPRIQKKRRASGIKKPRPPRPPKPPKPRKETFVRQAPEPVRKYVKDRYKTAVTDIGGGRDTSPAGEAQSFLQREGYRPVCRCNADGVPTQGGAFWICGRSKSLNDAELIARADEIRERRERMARRWAA